MLNVKRKFQLVIVWGSTNSKIISTESLTGLYSTHVSAYYTKMLTEPWAPDVLKISIEDYGMGKHHPLAWIKNHFICMFKTKQDQRIRRALRGLRDGSVSKGTC